MAKCISCPYTTEYQDRPFTCTKCKLHAEAFGAAKAPDIDEPEFEQQYADNDDWLDESRGKPYRQVGGTFYYNRTDFDAAVDFIYENNPYAQKGGRKYIATMIVDLMRKVALDKDCFCIRQAGVMVMRSGENRLNIYVAPGIAKPGVEDTRHFV